VKPAESEFNACGRGPVTLVLRRSESSIDHAMCVYFGCEPDSAEIQIGMREERFADMFDADVPSVKERLDEILAAAVKGAPRGHTPDGLPVRDWLASELPALSRVCRQKIASEVFDRWFRG
jgi:hypothetical protein